jgi:sugar-specific transcriptional regulator TrmB
VLETIGITGTAARIYSELVETEQLSVAEAAGHCGISVRQASAELSAMESLGLAVRIAGRPVRYRPVAPDLAISSLITQREKELQDARATMHQLTDVFQATSRGRHPDAHVEVVRGTPNIARLIVQVHEQSKHQIRGFDRARAIRWNAAASASASPTGPSTTRRPSRSRAGCTTTYSPARRRASRPAPSGSSPSSCSSPMTSSR